jgi:hypothetical protein
MDRAWMWTPMLMALAGSLVGCGPVVLIDDEATQTSGTNSTSTSTSTTSPGTTVPPPGTTVPPPGTTVPPPPDTTSGPDDTGGFIFDGFDESRTVIECDMFLQDCPPGEKCMPWANDGGEVWNATRCSPVADDPAGVGEPCMVEGSGTSGIDSCDYGAMCWDVDPETNEGTCVPFCMGEETNPTCPEGSVCAISNEGVLILCLPTCDPLLQSCPDGQACVPWSDTFICVPHESEGAGGPGDPCEFVDACEPGLVCMTELVPDCMAAGCCTALCDLTDPMPPCLPEHVCMPWFEPGTAPPGLENVGVCALPM